MVVYQSLSVIFNLIVILKFVSGTCTLILTRRRQVSHGSILSVTIFSLKIYSSVSCLLRDIKFSLYVDDLSIYYRSSHPSRESYNNLSTD